MVWLSIYVRERSEGEIHAKTLDGYRAQESVNLKLIEKLRQDSNANESDMQ